MALSFSLMVAISWVVLSAEVQGDPGLSPRDTRRLQLSDDAIVAVVEAEEIRYGAVRVSRAAAGELFEHRQQGRSVEAFDGDSFEAFWAERERVRLAVLVQVIVRNREVSRLGITVTEEEIDRRLEEVARDADPPSVANADRERYLRLMDAVAQVHERGNDPDTVFERSVSGNFTRSEWQIAVKQFENQDIRDKMKAAIREGLQDDPEFHRTVRAIVVEEKLRQAVIEEIAKTDHDFAEHVGRANSRPTHPKAGAFPPGYIDGKIYGWWEARYSSAHVDIREPSLRTNAAPGQ